MVRVPHARLRATRSSRVPRTGTLAVTRALGDMPLKKYVVSHPYTTETTLKAGQDAFLILACDGIWDVMSDAEAVDLVAGIPDAIEASETLLKTALKGGSMDNITSMVVRLHWPADSTAPKADLPPATADPMQTDGASDLVNDSKETDLPAHNTNSSSEPA